MGSIDCLCTNENRMEMPKLMMRIYVVFFSVVTYTIARSMDRSANQNEQNIMFLVSLKWNIMNCSQFLVAQEKNLIKLNGD